MELLDIVNEKDELTGKTFERLIVHELGLLHHCAHVWLVREVNNDIQVLLQKRSENKDSYPGCYDISSAGHIPAGCSYIESALRELKEELGIIAQESKLHDAGRRYYKYHDIFHGKKFCDNEIAKIYYMWCDLDEESFTIQKEELSGLKWISLKHLYEQIHNKTIKHCIYEEELDMISCAIQEEKRKMKIY